MLKFSLKSVAIAALALAGASASAALTPTSPACNTADVDPNSFACLGSFDGNDKNQQVDVLAAISGWGSFSYIGSSDTVLTFGPFASNPEVTEGTLTFDSAIDGPFVLALKAGNQFSLYFYDGSGDAISSIDFSTEGTNLNNQGIPNALSHASLYAGSPIVPGIPEPETYALMLAGLGIVGFMARRRRAD
ncbi:hypothetical protein BURC_02526 [Burkholderiaceae bacterium]|nr:hypothetical protein BURC_02526 [Burkholderiaceae bacterium]